MGLWEYTSDGAWQPAAAAAFGASPVWLKDDTSKTGGADFSGLSIDSGVLYGVPPWSTAPPQRISRREAIRVPAVKRSRDLIANAVGGLPLHLRAPDGTSVQWPLFEQPEAGFAPTITWTSVAEDLLFEGIAWLRVTHTGWKGYPTEVVRLDPTTVTVQPDQRVFYAPTGNGTALEWLPDRHLIRIDSPNDPLLVAGAEAIRVCLALNNVTSKASGGLPPLAVVSPADGETDPPTQEEVNTLMATLRESRAKGEPLAYIGAALKLTALGWSPDQLQLPELRDQAVLEIARISGVDPEELGVSTTSRTYFNAFDRKQNYIQFTVKAYLDAIAGRLSMPSTTPRGYKAMHALDDFFKADTLSRYQAYEVGLRVGAVTLDEIRALEGKPPLTPEQREDVRAALAKPSTPIQNPERPKEIEA